MTSKTKVALALLNLANRIESAATIEYGQGPIPQSRTDAGNSSPRRIRRPLKAGGGAANHLCGAHRAALRVAADLRLAALDCADTLIERGRLVALLERTLALNLMVLNFQISQSVIDFMHIYKLQSRTTRRHLN